MTETQIRFATFFVAGLAIGGGTTFIITKSKLEKKYKNLADEEINSVKATYERLREESEKAMSVTEEDIFDGVPLVDHPEVSEEDLYNKREVLTEEEVVNYNRIVSNYQPNREKIQKPRNTNAPYLITSDEFMEDGIHDDEKITLTYYDECGTVANEDDEIMDRVAEHIGEENLEHFGDNPDDPDVIHIRNEQKEVDYEIVRNPLSYSEVVLGIKDWDAKDVKQKKRPKKMRNDE